MHAKLRKHGLHAIAIAGAQKPRSTNSQERHNMVANVIMSYSGVVVVE
jgi:hypothetical protein